jgi:hypothetical protein
LGIAMAGEGKKQCKQEDGKAGSSTRLRSASAAAGGSE